MALLLRYNGIPARVAVGFTTGEAESRRASTSVSTNNAHAWVEVYFPTVGWVAFDPTPGTEPPQRRRFVHQPGLHQPLRDDSSPGSRTVDHRARRPMRPPAKR